jgi:hypothetical protein
MLICWFHKLRAILTGRSIESHATHCANCRSEQAQNRALESRLRNARPQAQVPFGFTNRVLSKASRAELIEMDEPMAGFPWSKLAIATVSILLAGLFIFQTSIDRRPAKQMARKSGLKKADKRLVELPRVSSDQIKQLTVKLDQPLQNELQYMISDTRQAIQFVASNFIPDER